MLGGPAPLRVEGDVARAVLEDELARELAAHLADALNAGRYAKLTLVASNPFLGMLAAQLPAGVRRCVDAQLANDYTQLAQKDLQARLKEQFGTPR